MTDQQASKAIVERFIDEYYRRGNLDIFDELLAPDFVFAGVGAEFQGDIEKLKEMAAATHTMLHTAVPNLEVAVDEIVAEGNTVVVRLTAAWHADGPLRRRALPR
ncbi:MAG: ester cyclase [Dehalococcoidia bacterium]|nr:ester cyclase [Dehalococcoidia bacterium]